MQKLGIVGGLGPESTIAYYRSVIDRYRALTSRQFPPLIINSIDMERVVKLVERNDLSPLAEYLAGEVRTLADAGATLGLIAANTPHIVFDEVVAQSPIPLVSIVRATCEAAAALRLRRVAILGTRFTMEGRFYPDVFSKAGIELVVPDAADRSYVHKIYMGELVKGVFLADTRDRLLRIIDTLRRRDLIDGVILAGTELPLILTEESSSGTPLLDTTEIHVNEAVKQLWG